MRIDILKFKPVQFLGSDSSFTASHAAGKKPSPGVSGPAATMAPSIIISSPAPWLGVLQRVELESMRRLSALELKPARPPRPAHFGF